MKREVMISVSTDPVKNFSQVVDYAKSLQGLTDFLHCDIMDGKFVPSKTYDESVLYNINQNCLTMLDVHLMVSEPASRIDGFIDAGANIVTIHYEAFNNKENLNKALQHIKQRKTLCGISFCPSTPVADIKMFLYDVDVVLVMGVEPGASGQKMLADTPKKVRELAQFRDANKLNFKIEVDGGINADNAPALIEAGVDIIVSGNYVYKSRNREEAINSLRGK